VVTVIDAVARFDATDFAFTIVLGLQVLELFQGNAVPHPKIATPLALLLAH
jgi:hypothetical protein